MEKQETNSDYFILKGITSILIGVYLFVGSFSIKYILEDILTEDSFIKDVSPQNIPLLILVIIILVLIAVILTFIIGAKKQTKKINLNLWNLNTKKLTLFMFLFLCSIIVLFTQGFVNFITPILLIFYAIFLFSVKNKERKDFLILSGLSLILGILCFLIPSYWYSSLSILAIAHITYGVVVK